MGNSRKGRDIEVDCKNCHKLLNPKHTAYIASQTGGLCWDCFDEIQDKKFFNSQNPLIQAKIIATKAWIETVFDKEIDENCQLDGFITGRRK